MVTIIVTVVSGRGAALRRVRAAQDSRGEARAGAVIRHVNAGIAQRGQPVPARPAVQGACVLMYVPESGARRRRLTCSRRELVSGRLLHDDLQMERMSVSYISDLLVALSET
jgi:hypothetical protein